LEEEVEEKKEKGQGQEGKGRSRSSKKVQRGEKKGWRRRNSRSRSRKGAGEMEQKRKEEEHKEKRVITIGSNYERNHSAAIGVGRAGTQREKADSASRRVYKGAMNRARHNQLCRSRGPRSRMAFPVIPEHNELLDTSLQQRSSTHTVASQTNRRRFLRANDETDAARRKDHC
jgi:hypothetical protein